MKVGLQLNFQNCDLVHCNVWLGFLSLNPSSWMPGLAVPFILHPLGLIGHGSTWFSLWELGAHSCYECKCGAFVGKTINSLASIMTVVFPVRPLVSGPCWEQGGCGDAVPHAEGWSCQCGSSGTSSRMGGWSTAATQTPEGGIWCEHHPREMLQSKTKPLSCPQTVLCSWLVEDFLRLTLIKRRLAISSAFSH